MLIPVALYRYLLPNLYLSVADIANPDLFVCGSRTWTTVTAAPRVCCVVWSPFAEVISSVHRVQYLCWCKFLMESVSSNRDAV